MSRHKLPRFLKAVALAAGLLVSASGASAQSLDDVKFHGFISQGFLFSTGNNYTDDTLDGTFQFTEVGLSLSTKVQDKLRLGLQLFSRDFGDLGNFDLQMDWAYADYRVANEFGIRAGKFKQPVGFYNETQDIDAVRTSVLLPAALYDPRMRDLQLAIIGTGVYGTLGLGQGGSFEYKAFGGFSDIDANSGLAEMIADSGVMTLEKYESKSSFGGQLIWNTPLQGLRVGASGLQSDFSYETNLSPALQALGMPSSDETTSDDFRIVVGSAEYIRGNLTLAAEFSRMQATLESEVLPVFEMNQESYYVQGAYRFTPWLELGAYYSVVHPDANDKDGELQEVDHRAWSKDLTLSARIDLNQNWIVKLESHFINGTAGLFVNENEDGFEKNWTLFAAKTSFLF